MGHTAVDEEKHPFSRQEFARKLENPRLAKDSELQIKGMLLRFALQRLTSTAVVRRHQAAKAFLASAVSPSASVVAPRAPRPPLPQLSSYTFAVEIERTLG